MYFIAEMEGASQVSYSCKNGNGEEWISLCSIISYYSCRKEIRIISAICKDMLKPQKGIVTNSTHLMMRNYH